MKKIITESSDKIMVKAELSIDSIFEYDIIGRIQKVGEIYINS